MANAALAVLETALRHRKLDRTLTTALPPIERADSTTLIPFDLAALDMMLRGGLPRGQLSEIAGPSSSGRTTLLLRLLGVTTRADEIAAFVDTCDRLDVASAQAAGIDFERLLWIRGESFVDRAIKALNLVLQAGGFAIVAIDLADVPPRELKSLPLTTWLRLQRVIEGSDTACVLIVREPLARSAGGLTVMCTGQPTWDDATPQARLTGLATAIRVVSPRRHVVGEAAVKALAIDESTNLRIDGFPNRMEIDDDRLAPSSSIRQFVNS
jgi:hypothetical protein